MEIILIITIIIFLFIGAIVYLIYPEKYLKYREKDVNSRDVELLRIQGVLLLLVAIFFIVMFVMDLD